MAEKADKKGEKATEPATLSELGKHREQERAAAKAPAQEPTKGTRVRATDTGFYGGHRRRKGKTFILAAGDKVASWMQVITE